MVCRHDCAGFTGAFPAAPCVAFLCLLFFTSWTFKKLRGFTMTRLRQYAAGPIQETSNVLTSDEPQAPMSLLFESPGADVILRSNDSHHFRVPKSFIVHCSPVLDNLILKALNSSNNADAEASLPVVQLPESGAIIHSLLTFIFPVTSLVPSTAEKAMILLSVAQKYQMASVLAHIRYGITRQNPPSTRRDTALHIYSLAQKHGLHQEALHAAQIRLKYSMSIEGVEDKLDMMPGAALYELVFSDCVL
jgi:hypothetical protein